MLWRSFSEILLSHSTVFACVCGVQVSLCCLTKCEKRKVYFLPSSDSLQPVGKEKADVLIAPAFREANGSFESEHFCGWKSCFNGCF